MKFHIILFFVLIFVRLTFAQEDNLQLGKTTTQTSAAVYDLSDPTGVNMEVSLWGFIRFPGRYRLPVKSTFMDLISYAGGPLEDSNLDEIRIVRNAVDTTGKKGQIIKLNYNDIMWEDRVKVDAKRNPILQPNDVVIIMQEKRFTFREDMYFILPLITTVISIITFIITLKK